MIAVLVMAGAVALGAGKGGAAHARPAPPARAAGYSARLTVAAHAARLQVSGKGGKGGAGVKLTLTRGLAAPLPAALAPLARLAALLVTFGPD